MKEKVDVKFSNHFSFYYIHNIFPLFQLDFYQIHFVPKTIHRFPLQP